VFCERLSFTLSCHVDSLSHSCLCSAFRNFAFYQWPLPGCCSPDCLLYKSLIYFVHSVDIVCVSSVDLWLIALYGGVGVVRWWTGPWQHCSVTCGDQGLRKRTVLCVRQLGPDQQIALEDWQCENLDRPSAMSACRRQQPCPPELGQWRTGPWSDVRNFVILPW